MTAYIFKIITLLGGLALFLFGMDIMGKALERQAGGKLQTIMAKMSSNVFKGFLLGLGVTAVIQSSSATTVMVVGFVNSGIMTLKQAVGVIMGSNIGTTVTAWILSLSGLEGDSFLIKLFKPSTLAPLIGIIGIVLYMGKSEKKRGIGTIMLGFMALMTGMDLMSSSMSFLKSEAWFAKNQWYKRIMLADFRHQLDTGHRVYDSFPRITGIRNNPQHIILIPII